MPRIIDESLLDSPLERKHPGTVEFMEEFLQAFKEKIKLARDGSMVIMQRELSNRFGHPPPSASSARAARRLFNVAIRTAFDLET